MKGIIIFGEKGSGKDTVADLIQSNSDKIVSRVNIGDLVRNMSPIFEATDRWKDDKRTFFVEVAKKLKELDINFLSYYVEGKIKEKLGVDSLREIDNKNLVIVTGGRTEEDYEYWKEQGFKVVGVTCSDEVRKIRLSSRDGYVQNNRDTLEEHTKEIIKKADIIIDNSGTLQELENQIKELF